MLAMVQQQGLPPSVWLFSLKPYHHLTILCSFPSQPCPVRVKSPTILLGAQEHLNPKPSVLCKTEGPPTCCSNVCASMGCCAAFLSLCCCISVSASQASTICTLLAKFLGLACSRCPARPSAERASALVAASSHVVSGLHMALLPAAQRQLHPGMAAC
jgi:hypothetical protein